MIDKNFRIDRQGKNTNICREGRRRNINYEYIDWGRENDRKNAKYHKMYGSSMMGRAGMGEKLSLGNLGREKTENVFITGILEEKNRRKIMNGGRRGISVSCTYYDGLLLPANGILMTWHAFRNEILIGKERDVQKMGGKQ